MSKQVTDSKGQTVTYKQPAFNYDIKRKFLRLQEQTNDNHTNERHDKTAPDIGIQTKVET